MLRSSGENTVNTEGFVPITYEGPLGSHMVPSPTKKVSNYGFRTRGDKFSVHPDDVSAAPNVFVAVAAAPQVLEAPIIEMTVVPASKMVSLEVTDAVASAPVADIKPEEPVTRRIRTARVRTEME